MVPLKPATSIHGDFLLPSAAQRAKFVVYLSRVASHSKQFVEIFHASHEVFLLQMRETGFGAEST